MLTLLRAHLPKIKIMEKGNENNLIKLIISMLFLLISLNIFLLKINPMPGYVYSFYEHVPILFWIFSIIIFLCASILLMKFRFLQSKYVYLLFFLILFNNAVILFSPYICGAYMMSGGDILSHGGMVLDIFHNGKIDFNVNYSPLTHILAFSISSLSNIDYMDSVKILSPIFSLLLSIYFYILAKEITDDQYVQNLTFLISSTFYFSNIFNTNSITTPMALSYLMLPLLFYLFIKSMYHSKKLMSFILCLLLSFSAYVFFHPLTSVLLISSFILLYAIEKSMKMQFIHRNGLFFLVAVSAYFIYLTKIWVRPIKNIYYFFLGYKITLGYMVDIREYLGKLGLTGYNLTSFFIKAFGHQALLLLLSFLSTIFIIFRQKRKNTNVWFLPIFAFLLASSILFLVQLVFPSTINISSLRFLKSLLVFSPILSSLFLLKLRKRILIIPVLMFLFINSLLVVYTSPYINLTNSQITRMDLSGSQWILDHKKQYVGLSGYSGREITIRMISGLIPYSQYYSERYIWHDEKSVMPDYLGYEENGDIWNTLQEERYLIINKYDIVAYTQSYRNVGRISLEDIEKVNNDYTAMFIYDAKDYIIFYILR